MRFIFEGHGVRNSLLFLGLFGLLMEGLVLADGGKPKNSEQWLNNQVTVFIAPDPVRVGPVEVQVMIQDLTTGNPKTDLKTTIHATQIGNIQSTLGGVASSEAITNKLMVGRIITIPAEGKWQISIQIEAQEGLWRKLIPIDVYQPIPQWLQYAGYIAWPAAAVLVFVLHRTIVRRRTRAGRDNRLVKKTGPH